MGIFRRFNSTTLPSSSVTDLSQADIIALIDSRVAGSSADTRDVELRTMGTDVTLTSANRFWQMVTTGGVSRTITVPAGASNWIKHVDGGILTVRDGSGNTVASLTQGQSVLVLWDVETNTHSRIDNLVSAGSSQVNYFPLDVASGDATLNYAPADGELAYVHRIDSGAVAGTNKMIVDVSSVAGLQIWHKDISQGSSVFTTSSGGLYIFRRVGLQLRMLYPEFIGSSLVPVVREARMNFVGPVLAGTVLAINGSGPNYTYTGSTTFNLGVNAAAFDGSTLLRVMLNGVEQVNGVDVAWDSAFGFSFVSQALSLGDFVSLKELQFT